MSRAVLAALALFALLCAGGVTSSGADFAATSSSGANSFAADSDFNTVAVTLADPGDPLRGDVALGASASSERGIERVLFQSSPAGAGAWSDACEATAAPYSCDWDTAAVADGSRDVRAVAIDGAGYRRDSVVPGVAVDNTRPVVTLADPGYLQGDETLAASATDAGTGLAALELAYRPAGGGPWSTLCSGDGSPLSCALATAGLPDGPYELRATATDRAGNADAALLTRTADNNAPSVTVAAPASAVRATIAFAIDAADGAGSGVASVGAELRASGGAWTPLCSGAQCASVDTTQLADGTYDVRATAVDAAGLTGTSAANVVRVDNTAPPAPTLASLPVNLEGVVATSGTVVDPGADVASWAVRYRPAGGGAWTDGCADSVAPYACSWDTAAAADGLYDVQAVTRDAAGNETASATLTNRRIDNDAPVLTLAEPAAYLRNTVPLSATATDPAGVQSVVFERRLASGTTWTTICTDTTAPYTCNWNTSSLADGSYELRARATDTRGHTSSASVGLREVDNTDPEGDAVESGNGGATAGRLEPGDWLRLTWTEQIAPDSVLAGWDGVPVAIRVRVLNDGNTDDMNFWDATGSTRLGLADSQSNLALNANFVSSSAWFDATMTQAGASITVTLGAQISGTVVTAGSANMRWTPSDAATDLAGNSTVDDSVSESNPRDRDF